MILEFIPVPIPVAVQRVPFAVRVAGGPGALAESAGPTSRRSFSATSTVVGGLLAFRSEVKELSRLNLALMHGQIHKRLRVDFRPSSPDDLELVLHTMTRSQASPFQGPQILS